MDPSIGIERNRVPNHGAAMACWIALIAALSVAGSLAFSCAAPLAAIAALAAAKMRMGEGLVLVVTAWLANQVVGYAVLDYPETFESFAWGAAMGAATVAGFMAARHLASSSMPEQATLAVAFGTAFVTYEAVLFTASAVLPSSEEVFSLAVVSRILAIDAVAFAGLVLLHKAAVALALLPARMAPEPLTA